MVAGLICGSADEVTAVIDSFADIGADDADDVKRLAEIVF